MFPKDAQYLWEHTATWGPYVCGIAVVGGHSGECRAQMTVHESPRPWGAVGRGKSGRPSDAESSASLCTSAALNLEDRVLGEVEKNSFLTLSGKGGLSKLMPSKSSVPPWETIVRSFTVIVQRVHGQLVDILLMGWCGGEWESASSTFWFQLFWDLHVCGQLTIVNS